MDRANIFTVFDEEKAAAAKAAGIELTDKQHRTLNRLFNKMNMGDFATYHLRSMADIGRGQIMVHGHVGDSIDLRWFDDCYSFIIGVRSAVTMISGPDHMQKYKRHGWCGIHINIR